MTKLIRNAILVGAVALGGTGCGGATPGEPAYFDCEKVRIDPSGPVTFRDTDKPINFKIKNPNNGYIDRIFVSPFERGEVQGNYDERAWKDFTYTPRVDIFTNGESYVTLTLRCGGSLGPSVSLYRIKN